VWRRTCRTAVGVIWIEAARRRFGSFVELNAWLGERCRSLWNEVRHPEHSQFSVAEILEHERPHLMPMPSPSMATWRSRRGCRAPAWCRWHATATRCPASWLGRWSARVYPGGVVVVADDAVVARHERLSASGGTRYDWQHYIPLVQRKPGPLRNGRALRRHARGAAASAPWSAAPGRRGPRWRRYWPSCRRRG
jgi:hypothetical protein